MADTLLHSVPASRSNMMTPAEFALTLGGFGIGTGEFAIMGLLPDVARDTAVSVPTAGIVISAYALGVVIGAPVIAVLAARFSRHNVLLALMAIFALGNIASAFAPGFLTLVAARFFTGLPHGAYFGVAAIVAAGLAPPHQKARSVARVMMGLTVATLVGTPMTAWFGQIVGWRAAFGIVGALSLITIAMTLRFVPKDKPEAGASPLRELGALGKLQVWLALGVCAVGGGGLFAVFTYITPAMTEVAGVPLGLVPVMLALFGAGMIAGNLIGARLADWSIKYAIGLALLFNLTAFLLYAFTMNTPAIAALNIFLVGCGFLLVPAIQMRLINVAGEAQTLAAALSHSAFNLANALGAWGGGVAIAHGYGWTSTGLVGAVVCLGALAVWAVALSSDRRRW
ncbi:MFS transporter [Xaviernesmea oryzae]|uniref:MFS transporter n=1 Tax=Xaviernesmea oryzae TaxID=464029 RepID=A0A1Q9ASN1_9HYPH|nr:MFS transporter [Xaviernesmea oryzae]OLP58398.1 MFS transporter [Xaviernesmea oryzae]SEL41706.1 MFS transporter, DHA1 family, arabinose polymer transporter [Xaviernesmea oryzae]